VSILRGIVDTVREEVARRRDVDPLEAWRDELGPADRDFASALRAPGLSLIAEFKPRSPSRGELRSRDEVEAVAATYDRRAAAMSVLCDSTHFGGGHDLLRRARKACSLPVLCKDFVVGEYQVCEARRAGADAILLMAAVLDDGELSQLTDLAGQWGMDAIVEVHDDIELDRVLALGSPIVGINSRNLHTLRTDLAGLGPLVDRVPSGPVVVAESGIHDRSDLVGLPRRVDAVLVGTALMQAVDVGTKLGELGW
jgi:indole-3-glycerol phosphate synthase